MDAVSFTFERCTCSSHGYLMECPHGTNAGRYHDGYGPPDRESLLRFLVDVGLSCSWGCTDLMLLGDRLN
jgi:hypothetical protein